MKICTIISILFLLSCQQSIGQEDRKIILGIYPTCKKDGLKGNVKRVKQDTYSASLKFGEIVQGERKQVGLNAIMNYNINGNKITEEWYFYENWATSILESKTIIQFDDKCNMISKSYYTYKNIKYDSSYSSASKYICKYDSSGNMIENNFGDIYGSSLEKYKYDENKNITEEKDYGSDGRLTTMFNYEYNDKGYYIGYIQYLWGNISDKYTYKYNDKGNVIEVDDYLPNDKLNNKDILIYDSNGNVIESTLYAPNGGIIGSKHVYQYTYDQQGNWIKKIEIIKGKMEDNPIEIIIRTLEYY